MRGRAPTKEEKEFMDRICQLGCIVCRNNGYYTPQVSPHHMDGKTKEGAHFKVIPLCGKHHQEPDNHKPARWVSRHGGKGNGKAAFEKAYGKEEDLLYQCKELIVSSSNV